MPETQGSEALPGVLAAIVATKQGELEALRARAAELEVAASGAGAPRDFARAVSGGERVALIAECKRRSPGAGEIRPGLVPADLARAYEGAGAAALSVLTDAVYFGGRAADLSEARAATRIPVLRKDFTLDPLHVIEARAAGADAVLLIVRILDDATLDLLHREATGLEMSVLVEVHDRSELERALRLDAPIVGINNRDLSTFQSDLETTLRLVEEVPPDVTVVSESGIGGPGDVVALGEAGVHAVLVGETLLRSDDPGDAARALSSVARSAHVRA